MVAIGDVLKITDLQFNSATNKEFMNVYHYEVQDATGVLDWYILSGELAQEFVDNVVQAVRNVQHSAIRHIGIQIRNMNSPYEEFEQIYPSFLSGIIVSPQAPSFVTLNFKYLRRTSATRNGRKSIGGLPEEYTTGANGTDLQGLPVIQSLQTALSSLLTVESDFGMDATYAPVIYRPVSNELGPPKTNYINGVRYQRNGTQNTRK